MRKGFTIVELLIVIVVIAILAAITIVAYTGIQDRAKQAAVQSAASQASKKVAAYAVDNTDLFPQDEATFLSATSTADTSELDYVYLVSPDRKHYCVSATNTANPTLSSAVSDTSDGVVAGRCVRNYASDPAATSNASGTIGVIGWRSGRWFGSSPAAGSYAAVSGASDGALGRSTYVRKTWSVAPTSIGGSGDTGMDNIPGGINGFPVVSGAVWSISCYVRASVTRNYHIGVYQYTSTGASFSPTRFYGSDISGPAGQWTRIHQQYAVPSGVAYAALTCDSSASSANGAVNWAVGSTLDATALMVTQGAGLYQFADGSSSAWSWDGTPNNSTSFGPAVLQ